MVMPSLSIIPMSYFPYHSFKHNILYLPSTRYKNNHWDDSQYKSLILEHISPQ